MTLILIDASSWMHRAYHATPKLSRSDGHPIGAVVGFCSMLFAFMRRPPAPVDYIACVFDAPGRTFRHAIAGDHAYKGNRKPKDDDLGRQFPILREAVAAFDIPVVELAGYEADDIIATYVRIAGPDHDIIIYGADKDLLQLVSPTVRLFDTAKNRFIDAAAVIARYGVAPEQMPHLQALMGDATDNIPGVPGIGEKTAAKLIAHYGDIDAVLAAMVGDGVILPPFVTPRLRAALVAHAAQARLALRLTTLNPLVPLASWSLDSIATRPVDVRKVLAFLRGHEIAELTKRIENEWGFE